MVVKSLKPMEDKLMGQCYQCDVCIPDGAFRCEVCLDLETTAGTTPLQGETAEELPVRHLP